MHEIYVRREAATARWIERLGKADGLVWLERPDEDAIGEGTLRQRTELVLGADMAKPLWRMDVVLALLGPTLLVESEASFDDGQVGALQLRGMDTL